MRIVQALVSTILALAVLRVLLEIGGIIFLKDYQNMEEDTNVE